MIALVALAALASAPQPGSLKTFADWTVGCDNGRACQAVGLLDEDGDAGDGRVTMVIAVGPEAASTPRITIGSELADIAGLAADGTRLATRVHEQEGTISVAGEDGRGLIDAIGNAARLALIDKNGRPVGYVSLYGSSAALRYIDDRQRRVGTVTAFVAKGVKPAAEMPPPPALPVVVVPMPGTKPAVRINVTAARQMTPDDDECDADPNTYPVASHRLDVQHTLVMVPMRCGNGAYNDFTTALLADEHGTLTLARFDSSPGMQDEEDATLVNARWDNKAHRLFGYAKGRGLGDCGIARTYAWDGNRFRLVELSRMDECRGSVDYITV